MPTIWNPKPGDTFTTSGADTWTPDNDAVLEDINTGERIGIKAGETYTFLKPVTIRYIGTELDA